MEKEVAQRMRVLKQGISGIRSSLDKLQAEKEQNYQKKGHLSRKIGELIARIKGLMLQRDAITQQVKEKKEKRNKNNETIKSELSSINSLKAEMQKLMRLNNIRLMPSKLKDLIEELEYKLQTEGYTFEREKEVMKKIKGLKSQLQSSQEIMQLISAANSRKKAVRELRKDADRLHFEIRSQSAESQKLHEEILRISEEIDGLKPKKEEAAERWAGLKGQIGRLNLQLKEKLQELGHAKAEMDRLDSLKIKTKEEEAENKIRRGEKLTTEDLLAFQEFERR